MKGSSDNLQGALARAVVEHDCLSVEGTPPWSPEWNALARFLGDILVEVQRREGVLNNAQRGFEQTLSESQQRLTRLQNFQDFAVDGYLMTDAAGIISKANHAAALILNVRREFLLGRPLGLYIAQEEWHVFYSQLLKIRHLDENGRRTWRFRIRPQDGRSSEVEATVHPVIDTSQVGPQFEWTLRDCTASVLARDALAAEAKISGSLFDLVPAFILTLGRNGEILRFNSFTGVSLQLEPIDFAGKPWWALLMEKDRAPAIQAFTKITESGMRSVTARVRVPTGVWTVSWMLKLLESPGPNYAIAVGHDITALQKAQDEALRTQRLAAIGQMMTTLAHESRNALQRSQACLERLKWRVEGRPDELDLVKRTQQAQVDLARLFDDVRQFAAPMNLTLELCDVTDIWREAWRQACEVRPQHAATFTEIGDGAAGRSLVDRFRLTQVFRNLFDNSFEAATGPLEVIVRSCHSDGSTVRISVRDNGQGIAEDQRENVFDPFFTTKTTGTGLGMAIVKRIIEAHGGTVSLHGGRDEKPETTHNGTPDAGLEVRFSIPRREP